MTRSKLTRGGKRPFCEIQRLDISFPDGGGACTQLVALNGRFLGTVTVTSVGKPAAHFSYLFVHPAVRRHGIAEHLVNEACRIAKESGSKSIGLMLADGNEPAAALYRKLGFIAGFYYTDCKNTLMVKQL